MSSVTVCPHCGGENQGAKIKCHHCGRLLSSPDVEVEDAKSRSMRVIVGPMRGAELLLDTRGRRVVDITEQIQAFAGGVGETGLLNVFVPHATAGLGVMETESGSEADLEEAIDRLLPPDDRYTHRHGPPGHGRDHLLPVFLAPSITLPVDAGRVLLGTWQRVVVVDTNEANNERRVRLSFLSSTPPPRPAG